MRDSQTISSANAELPATSASDFGLVDGTFSITNANNPILWPLTGVSLTDPATGTNFTSLADSGGDYNVIVPLGVPGMDYPGMSIVPYDPITNSDLANPVTINLSGLTPTSPFTVPSVKGACVDTDAASPDSDDPDCD